MNGVNKPYISVFYIYTIFKSEEELFLKSYEILMYSTESAIRNFKLKWNTNISLHTELYVNITIQKFICFGTDFYNTNVDDTDFCNINVDNSDFCNTNVDNTEVCIVKVNNIEICTKSKA